MADNIYQAAVSEAAREATEAVSRVLTDGLWRLPPNPAQTDEAARRKPDDVGPIGANGQREIWKGADGTSETRISNETCTTFSKQNAEGKTTEVTIIPTSKDGEQYAEYRTLNGATIIVGNKGYLGLEPNHRIEISKDNKVTETVKLTEQEAAQEIAKYRRHVLR